MSDNTVFRQQNIVGGVVLIVAAALTISIQDVVFKLFSSDMTLWQIFALRGMLAIPMLWTVLWARGVHRGVVRAAFGKWPMLRSVFITTTFLAFYAAIPFLSLSTVGAANYLAPIFVALLSAYAIGEAVGPFGRLGVVLGFAGVVVLLQPGTDSFSPWALLPVVGAAFYAMAHITTRVKCQDTPLSALSLSQTVVMLTAGVCVSALIYLVAPPGDLLREYPYIFGMWSDIGLTDWLVLALLAGLTIVIGLMLASAYQAAPPAIVSTFEYSYLVFVAIWDIMFFGITPSFASVTGMTMIVAAGLLVLRRRAKTAMKQ